MPETAILFAGQGAQSVGMGKDIADASPAAAEVFDRANEVVGYDLRSICFEGPAEELARTDVQQPAIFATSVAIWRALGDGKDLGEPPVEPVRPFVLSLPSELLAKGWICRRTMEYPP